MLKLLREQKGSVAVLAAMAMTALLGCTALAIDVANLYLNKTQISNMADAAALAGARDLPVSSQLAISTAQYYANQNGKESDDIQASVNDNKTIVTVTVNRTVPLFFAKIFNMYTTGVSATAQASNMVITGVTGAVPFSIEKQDFSYGTPYTLKDGGGSGSDGNYGGLALGGNGGNIYKYNIKNGYNGKLTVGQWVDTETGTISGPTSDGVSYRIALDPYATYDTVKASSERIIVVPIIDSLNVNGKASVQIVGFAAFFLESVGGSGNDNSVTGRFLRMYIAGDQGSGTDYGLRNIRLIK